MSARGDLIRLGIDSDGKNVDIFDGKLSAQNFRVPSGESFYVDASVSVSGTGKSWSEAYLTVQEAIDASNGTIDWGASPWLVDNYIYIAPGLYAEALTPPYSCHMIGEGVLGTDTACEIHPAAGSAITGTGLGLHIRNIWFEAVNAVPIIDFGICNNTIFDNCVFAPAAATVTHGISFENASHFQLRNCYFTNGLGSGGITHGLYFAGGADKYMHGCRIVGNVFHEMQSFGIWIQNTCTASASYIVDNVIHVIGTGTGIHDANGNTYCIGNHIIVDGAGDAISHAGGSGHTLMNHCSVNGSYAQETA